MLFLQIINTFSNCIHDKDKRQFEEIVVETKDNLQEFEEELGIRKTPFFGGLYNFFFFFFRCFIPGLLIYVLFISLLNNKQDLFYKTLLILLLIYNFNSFYFIKCLFYQEIILVCWIFLCGPGLSVQKL